MGLLRVKRKDKNIRSYLILPKTFDKHGGMRMLSLQTTYTEKGTFLGFLNVLDFKDIFMQWGKNL